MKQEESLTNEKLFKKFGSQFELVNHAIKCAEHRIKKGQEPNPKFQNLAFELIREIAENHYEPEQLFAEEPEVHDDPFHENAQEKKTTGGRKKVTV